MTSTSPRRGARSLDAVPVEVLASLEAGEIETVNLMEWLRVDMSVLARNLASETPALRMALDEMAEAMRGLGVTGRLKAAGSALSGVDGDTFEVLAGHRSDIVRQWACYVANDPGRAMPLAKRLEATLRFADDRNMSVRETAWMAFRPHLPTDPVEIVALLMPLAKSPRDNVRRFAVEVSRPRSVWGAHLSCFKRNPALATDLLDRVMSDESRYVRLAVGNWLNDAAKTRPDWVSSYCMRWNEIDHQHTRFITKRGSRTISARKAVDGGDRLPGLDIGEAA